jgi:hypothetical protein
MFTPVSTRSRRRAPHKAIPSLGGKEQRSDQGSAAVSRNQSICERRNLLLAGEENVALAFGSGSYNSAPEHSVESRKPLILRI